MARRCFPRTLNLLALPALYVLFMGVTPAPANVWFRPRSIPELGAYVPQPASVVPAKAVWIDYARLRRDFPELRSQSDATLKATIENNFGLVTVLQRELEGTLLTPIGESSFETIVYHPNTYRRAAVTPFPGTQGLIDLKGTGLSPDHEETVRKFLAFYRALTGDANGLYMFGGSALAEWRAEHESLQAEISQTRSQLGLSPGAVSTESPEEQRRLRTRLLNLERDFELYDLFFPWLDDCLAKRTIEADTARADTFLQKLRARDYFNGTSPLSRAIKEAAVQRAVQALLQEHPQRELVANSLAEETVESYFVLELPYSIIGADGKLTRAGILGRQAHWRASSALRRASFLDGRVFNVINSNLQTDVFGSVVDFETLAITDPRVNHWAEWSDTRGQLVDTQAEKATAEYLAGNRQRLAEFLEELQAPLGPHSAPRSRLLLNASPLTDLFATIQRPPTTSLRLEPSQLLAWLDGAERAPLQRSAYLASLVPLVLREPQLATTLVDRLCESRWLTPERKTMALDSLFWALLSTHSPKHSPGLHEANARSALSRLLEVSTPQISAVTHTVLLDLLRKATIAEATDYGTNLSGFIPGNPVADELLAAEVFLALSNLPKVRAGKAQVGLQPQRLILGRTNLESRHWERTRLLADFPPALREIALRAVELVTAARFPEKERTQLLSQLVLPETWDSAETRPDCRHGLLETLPIN